MKTSIIAAVMNRDDRVKPALENWLAVLGVDEIMLVDWSSKNPVQPVDGVRVVRVENEPKWHLAAAYNLAATLASGDRLMKLDIDYRLRPDFLNRTLMRTGQFRHGDWSICENVDDKHLSGFMLIQKADFWAAGGYNEAITGYGHDDTELYARLRKSGLEGVSITKLNGIEHIPHDNASRFGNQPASTWDGKEFRGASTWTQQEDGTWTR